jgi:tetratricopeptide (TPR) repeat protein
MKLTATDEDPASRAYKMLQMGEELLARGELSQAENIAVQLLKLDSSNTMLLVFAGRVFIARQDWEKAERCFRRAADQKPDETSLMMTLAEIVSRRRGRMAEAIEMTERVLQKAPAETRILMSAGSLYSRAEKYERSYELFRKALTKDPDNGQINYMAATSARFLGDLEKAEHYADAAVRLEPDNYEGLFLRSDVRTQTPENNHIAELEEKISRGVKGRENQFHHYYVLAKEYEDLGQYAKSFEARKAGADIRRKGMAYKVEHDLEVMETLQEVFSEEFFRKNTQEGCPESGPIFILGMPRTGTTLLERTISSHSQVTAAGELNELSLMIGNIVKGLAHNPKMSKTELVRKSSELDFRQLGQTYIDATRNLGRGAPYWIDKMPINFLYCGLIHLSMPKAKMINMMRHPMDTCYANFKMLFNAGSPYSYSLDDLGNHYSAYYRLMQHWHRVIPGAIHTVHYEQLTANFEHEAREALAFCGLDWEDQVLEFHKNKAASTTASAAQVRRPIYTSSIQLWKNYEDQLEPLREVLESNGVPL